MSVQETDHRGAEAAHEETAAGGGHAHPSDGTYVQIALILAALTAAEVLTFYIEETLGAALVPILMVMMVVKFAIVAMWFMHLRFDSRMFSRLFVSGLVLAVLVYAGAIATFEFAL